MPSESSGKVHSQGRDEHVERLKRVLEQLDASIARLALALAVPLDSKEGLLQALHGGHAPVSGQAHAENSNQRWHSNLRGLLTLREELVRKCAEEVGYDTTLQLMVEIETHLLSQGFKPGADGLDLDQLRRPN